MGALSRREFGRLVLAGAPLTAAFSAANLSASTPLVFGVTTSSFRNLPRVTGRDNVDEVIRALRAVGAMRVELALANAEPAPPSTAPFMGGSPAYPAWIVFTPEQIAATNATYRRELRAWRLETPLDHFKTVRGKFSAAGITIGAGALGYDRSWTDAEIEASFRQIETLGISTVSSPMTMETAVRLRPFAERHRITVAIHNQANDNPARQIATPQIEEALALSPVFKLKLDIANITASNADAVAALREYSSRVSHVIVRDRLRNGGTSQPFGEGDTPITGVLEVLKASAAAIPVLVEYDYLGLRSPMDETSTSLAYLTRLARMGDR